MSDMTEIAPTAYQTLHATRCDCPACGSTQEGQKVEISGTSSAAADQTPINAPPTFSTDDIIDQLLRADAYWEANTVWYGFFDFAGPGFDYGEEADGFEVFSSAQMAAARSAMLMWDEVINLEFEEGPESLADIRFGNTSTGPEQAWAYFPGGGDVDGDVWINHEEDTNLELDVGQYGYHTLLHEIGHAIGIDHPSDYENGASDWNDDADYDMDSRQYTVMSYYDADESDSGADHYDYDLGDYIYGATPLLHDIAAAQALYGARTATRNTDTVYGFNSTANRDAFDFTIFANPVISIWDGGGIDTIDLSGYEVFQILDLREGAFSDIGDLYGNVSIAYGAVIENAIGSLADDDIIGNDVANDIRGGEGDDIIDGLGGNDKLFGDKNDDQLFGGDGNDKLKGGKGSDTLSGNADKDKLYGQDGNDTLEGGGSKDKLYGGAGDDTIKGGGGKDRYFLQTGDGTDQIEDDGSKSTSKADRVVLKDWEDYNDAFFTRSDKDLTIDYGNGDQATLYRHYHKTANHIEEIELGSSDNLLNIVDAAIGTDGDDLLIAQASGTSLVGELGDDLLVGGTGDDSFSGGGGDDAYLIGADGGTDTLQEGGTADDTDMLIFTSINNRNDLTLSQNGDDLIASASDGTELTVTDHFLGAASGIEYLLLGNGTLIDLTAPADDWLG